MYRYTAVRSAIYARMSLLAVLSDRSSIDVWRFISFTDAMAPHFAG